MRVELLRLMQNYHPVLNSPGRILGIGAVIVLFFAVLFPLTGPIETSAGQIIDFNPVEDPVAYFRFSFPLGLHLSVRTFTLVGTTEITSGGFNDFLVDLEALTGMVFFALLVASLVNVANSQ